MIIRYHRRHDPSLLHRSDSSQEELNPRTTLCVFSSLVYLHHLTCVSVKRRYFFLCLEMLAFPVLSVHSFSRMSRNALFGTLLFALDLFLSYVCPSPFTIKSKFERINHLQAIKLCGPPAAVWDLSSHNHYSYNLY